MTETPQTAPLWLKWAYTAFMAVLVPVYLFQYGPTNFVYFCDVALLLTLAGLWLDSALLISMCAVGIIAMQSLWLADFLAAVALGASPTGVTDYMLDSSRSAFLRGLSLFHGWLPILLVYLVWRMGYDRRGLVLWTLVAWAAIAIAYLFLPPPHQQPGLTPVNVNYVWGFGDFEKQTFMPQWAWLITMVIGLPALLYAPTHWLLRRYAPRAKAS